VLVVSAVEGVQAQTRILMRALRRLNIATITFINKIDRHGANPERVLEEMAGRLIPNVVAMGSVSNPGTKQARFNPFGPDDADFRTHLIDMLTIHDERIVTAFVEDEASLPFRMLRQKLREQVNRSLVVPVFFGSAITGQGIQGFVSRCLVRLDAALTTAGFEDALKGALRAADVLGTDETPAPLTTAAASAEGCGNPHVYTVRTLRGWTGGGPDLIWYGAAGNRTKAAITGFGILDGYRGVLVRDDYRGYLSYDAGLAGVQQCVAHLYRYLDDASRPARNPRPGPGRPGMRSARPRPPSGPPGTPARPAWTPPCWTSCATATTRPSPAGSPSTCPGPGTRATTPG